MIRKTRPPVLAVMVLALVAWVLPNAGAVGSVSFTDDYLNNANPYVGYNPKTDAPIGCDTLDPWPGLTVNSALVKYQCRPRADIKSFSLGTTADGFFEISWTLGATVPSTPQEVIETGLDSLTLLMAFENPNSQNARQIAGDTTDCTRYEHRGPYFTGDGYKLLFLFQLRITTDAQGASLLQSRILPAVFSPANLSWIGPAFAQPPYNGPATRCNGFTPVVVTNANDPGSRTTISISGNTVSARVPMTYHWYDQTAGYLQRDWVLASPGDPIRNVTAQSLGTIPLIAPPPPIQVGDTRIAVPISSSFPAFLDWAPWGGFDLGLYFGPPTLAPRIGVAEVGGSFGGGLTCPQYVSVAKGTNGEDNDVQINPFFGPGDGFNHYDSSQKSGTTTNQFVQQDHKGPNGCESAIPGGFGYRETGLNFTA